MKLRATWAALVMVMLLLVSSAATACEARCGVRAILPTCHAASAMEMPHVESELGAFHGVANASHTAEILAAKTASAPTCIHPACNQLAAVLADHRSALVPMPMLSDVASTVTHPFDPEQPVYAFDSRGPPFRRRLSPVELRVALRV